MAFVAGEGDLRLEFFELDFQFVVLLPSVTKGKIIGPYCLSFLLALRLGRTPSNRKISKTLQPGILAKSSWRTPTASLRFADSHAIKLAGSVRRRIQHTFLDVDDREQRFIAWGIQ